MAVDRTKALVRRPIRRLAVVIASLVAFYILWGWRAVVPAAIVYAVGFGLILSADVQEWFERRRHDRPNR